MEQFCLDRSSFSSTFYYVYKKLHSEILMLQKIELIEHIFLKTIKIVLRQFFNDWSYSF